MNSGMESQNCQGNNGQNQDDQERSGKNKSAQFVNSTDEMLMSLEFEEEDWDVDSSIWSFYDYYYYNYDQILYFVYEDKEYFPIYCQFNQIDTGTTTVDEKFSNFQSSCVGKNMTKVHNKKNRPNSRISRFNINMRRSPKYKNVPNYWSSWLRMSTTSYCHAIKRRKSQFPASRGMKMWLLKSWHYPYPSDKVKQMFVRKFSLTEKQVQIFMTNHRARLLRRKRIKRKRTKRNRIKRTSTKVLLRVSK